jgi:hypothetical protein
MSSKRKARPMEEPGPDRHEICRGIFRYIHPACDIPLTARALRNAYPALSRGELADVLIGEADQIRTSHWILGGVGLADTIDAIAQHVLSRDD